jgi:hypothetical protein
MSTKADIIGNSPVKSIRLFTLIKVKIEEKSYLLAEYDLKTNYNFERKKTHIPNKHYNSTYHQIAELVVDGAEDAEESPLVAELIDTDEAVAFVPFENTNDLSSPLPLTI